MKSVCLAILNYNGVRHLERLLPTAIEAVARYGAPCPILVLDNRSTEGDPEWIRARFPQVEVVVAPQNDHLFSYNGLLARRGEEIVVLLNNDLRLAPGFLAPLLRHFDRDGVFAACATSRDWEDTAFTCGPARLRSHHGFYYWIYEKERQQLAHTLFPSAGFMAVDRQKFLDLGGFNPLFRPAYGEDLDLGFRAWRRGWRSIFEPSSLVHHREKGTWGAADGAPLGLRSQLLFQWACLPAAAPWAERATAQLLMGIRRLAHGDPGWPVVWIRTWREWRRVRREYGWMKTSRAELEEILRRIEAPVPLDSVETAVKIAIGAEAKKGT